jgi:MFS family permease
MRIHNIDYSFKAYHDTTPFFLLFFLTGTLQVYHPGFPFAQAGRNLRSRVSWNRMKGIIGLYSTIFSREPSRLSIKMPETLRALRSRNYRLFFTAQSISLSGLWMHRVAMGWLVFRLTGSNGALGIMDFAASIPIFLFSPFSGALIERWDLRKTLFWCQACCMGIALLLAFLTLTHLASFRIVTVMALLLGLVDSFELPCRYALVSYMVDRKEDVSNAVALNSVVFNVARMIGPTVAGFVIHLVGEGACFLLNGLAYSSTLYAVRIMKMDRPPIGKAVAGKRRPLADMAEGIRMARDFAPARYFLFLIALTGFFAFPSLVLMPAMAKSVLGGTPETLGLLLMGVAIGALAGSLLMASLKSPSRLSWWCTRSCIGFGISVMLFSLSRAIAFGIALAAPVGFFMVTSTITCNTLLQTMVPREGRSRIMALYTFAILGFPPFGSLLAGRLGDMIGTGWALFVCGGLCAVSAFALSRKLDRLDGQVQAALEGSAG